MKTNHNYIYRRGTTPNTRVAISQKNKVYSVPSGQDDFQQIGVLSSFGWSEDRDVSEVRGVGYGDQVAELVPGVTSPMELSISRQLLYLSNVCQVFGYNAGVDGLVRSLKHHRWPFDVKHEMVFSRIATQDNVNKTDLAESGSAIVQASDTVNQALVTFFEACWMTDWGQEYSSDEAMITEDISATCTDVIDGTSAYGELAGDSTSTGNNPFNGNGSFRFNGTGTGVSSNLA